MANPVASFLAGFQAVDQLETNRQARQFRNEQQSRLRTLWERQDRDDARIQLDQRRQDNFVKFEAYSRSLMDEVSAKANVIGKEKGEDAKAKYLSEWFGDENVKDGRPTGFLRFSNEVINRMIASDPEFGEHLGLAAGVDPSGGPFIRDGRRPVSGALITPRGRMVFEVDSINGKQPLTQNRSADPDDPVYEGDLSMGFLTEVFGPSILTSDSALAFQIRNAAGIEPTGQLQSQNTRASGGTGTTPVPTTDAAAAAGTEAQAPNVVGSPPPPQKAEVGSMLGASSDEMSAASNKRAAVQAKNQAMLDTETDPARSGRFPLNEPEPTAREKGAEVAKEAKARGEALYEWQKGNTKLAYAALRTATAPDDNSLQGALRGFFSELLGMNDAEEAATITTNLPTNSKEVSAPAKTPGDVQKSAKWADYTRPALIQPGESAASAVAGAPSVASVEAAQQISDAMPVSTRRRKPTVPELFNAATLTKANVITPAQLFNFARTGQYDKASADFTFVNTAQGVFALDKTTGTGSLVPGTAPPPPVEEQPDDLAIFKAQRTLLENRREFQDEEGKVDEAKVQRALELTETASDILGLTPKQRMDRSILTSLNQGQLFVDRFDPDTVQSFDFNPFSDPELGPNNMVLGFVADQMGIDNQEEADHFLFDYGITFRNSFPNMSAEDVIKNVIAMETQAKGSREARKKVVRDSIAKATRNGQ